MERIDLTGSRYGRLTVKERAGANKNGQARWKCICDCGGEKEALGYNLKNETTRSCGCLAAENSRIQLSKVERKGARNPKSRKARSNSAGQYIPSGEQWYKRASGRYYYAVKHGIEVGFKDTQSMASYCQNISTGFCPVLGVPLVDGNTSIDRIDPSKGYVPGNLQIISSKANRMKNNATVEELRRFAEWVLSWT